MLGPTIRALAPVTIGLAGTMAATVAGSGERVEPGGTVTLRAGDTLTVDAATGALGRWGEAPNQSQLACALVGGPRAQSWTSPAPRRTPGDRA